MEHLSKILLYDSHVRDLNREAEQVQLEAQLPSRPVPWRALLVVAVILVGMIALWVH